MAPREERELVFRKGKWIDYPFEPCWNEYWLYTSDRILQQPLLRLEDVAAHLWFCARYHQDQASSSEYTWAELAGVWFGDPAREKAAKAIVFRLQAAGLLEIQPGKGRGKRSRVTPYDPLLEADFRLAAAKGCFGVPAQDRVVVDIPPAELAAFDFTQAQESYRVLKPRSFLRGRGWEPCLRTVFDLYLGDLVDIQERDGQSWVHIPGPGDQDDTALVPWNGPPLTRGRAVVRLTTVPLLGLAAIGLALWLRKRADQARLQREPWVTVSISQIRRQFHLRWTAVEALLTALENAGLARRIGGGRQAGANKANVPLRFLLWDPCENTADFLHEVAAGEIRAQLSPPGEAAMAQLHPGPRIAEAAGTGTLTAALEKPCAAEQGARKPAQREQGRSRKSKNPPPGNKGPRENPATGSKGGGPSDPQSTPGGAALAASSSRKPTEPEQHEHRNTNKRVTTTALPAVVVALLAEIAISPDQICPVTTPAEVEELVAALEEIQPGYPGYESRGEIAHTWLQRGPDEAVLTYLAAAADVRSSVARKKGLAELPFAYVRAVTEHVWQRVHGTPDYKYLAARVVRWLETQDPLPESWARQLRFDLLGDNAAEDGSEAAGGPVEDPGAAPRDTRASYAELLGVSLDLAPWEQVLLEVRRLGISPPDWAPAALLDVHGPRKAGRGEAEVWLLVPDDVDIDAVGRYLWEDGIGQVVVQTVHRHLGAPLPVAVGRYTDMVGYLHKLQERAHAAWEKVKQRLATQLPRSEYATWVEQSRGVDLHLGERRLTVSSQPAACPWLRREDFLRKTRREVQEILGDSWSVEIRAAATRAGPRS